MHSLIVIARVPALAMSAAAMSIEALLGTAAVKPHEFLYWEFHERGFQQAIRTGQWKAVRLKKDAPLELYDLSSDVAEQHDVAAAHPEVVQKIEGYLKAARTESEIWPVK